MLIRKPSVVLYHADCADGFGAAYAAWCRWGTDVQYVPIKYGQRPKPYENENLLILDFSLPRDELSQLVLRGNRIQLLDHHKSAESLLGGYAALGDDIQVYFDMERSGARLAWDFIHPDKHVPYLIYLIEDRDLWRFNLPLSKPFSYWLRTLPMEFEQWALVDARLEENPDGVFAEAKVLERYIEQSVQELLKRTRTILVDGIKVPAVNCQPQLASDVCDALLKANTDAPFVAVYSDHQKGRSYSLRSTDDREDVSVIAQKYGGGGHRNAAGFGAVA